MNIHSVMRTRARLAILATSAITVFFTALIYNKVLTVIDHLPSLDSAKSYKILLFTPYFFHHPWTTVYGKIRCGDHSCIVTGDKRQIQSSHAVVFHAWSVNLMNFVQLAKYYRVSNQSWIFCNRESPDRKGYDIYHKYQRTFNWTMSYRLDSDIWYPYGIVSHGKHRNGFDPNLNYLAGRNRSVAVAISHCSPDRLKIVKVLKKYIDVDFYGHCGDKVLCRDCWSVFKNYKFYFAIENSICTDYITEKTYRNAFDHDIVPVILSGANLSNPNVLPPGSYIDASKFSSAEDLANYLKQVGSDPKLYNKFFEWRAHWTTSEVKIKSTEPTCRICKKLHESRNASYKIYEDIGSWYNERIDCKPFPSWS